MECNRGYISPSRLGSWKVMPADRCNGECEKRQATPEELKKFEKVKPYDKPSFTEILSLKRKEYM